MAGPTHGLPAVSWSRRHLKASFSSSGQWRCREVVAQTDRRSDTYLSQKPRLYFRLEPVPEPAQRDQLSSHTVLDLAASNLSQTSPRRSTTMKVLVVHDRGDFKRIRPRLNTAEKSQQGPGGKPSTRPTNKDSYHDARNMTL